jgi:hypothetical protein
MDPGRRELYVEGVRDRVFIHWLTDGVRSPQASVIIIDHVEVFGISEGGNRARLKHFLVEVANSGFEIKGLLDADHGRLLGETLPPNSWTTDLRDAEGYVLAPENIDAALRLGCGIERVEADTVRSHMELIALRLAGFRLASEFLTLELPLSDLKLVRYVAGTPEGALTLDEVKLRRVLLNKAGVPLSRESDFIAGMESAARVISAQPSDQVIHGKDCMKLLNIQFKALGCDVNDVGALLWSSFRRERIGDFPVLSEVVEYMTKP